MNDQELVELYLKRDENAIKETEIIYGRKLNIFANSIVKSIEDSLECVNDTYLKTWKSIPPNKPIKFKSYIFKICRFICFGRLDYRNAQKRTASIISLTTELEECIPASLENTEIVEKDLGELISKFLECVSEEQKNIFIKRYWYIESISGISKNLNIKESKVKTTLFRLRQKLKKYLEEEGVLL